MSAIDQLIARGGGIDMPGIVQGAQMARENDLLNLGRQKQMQRAEVTNQREDAQYDRGMMFQAANEFVRRFEANDREGADQVISSLPDTGNLAQMKSAYFAAKQTASPEDDMQILNNAKAVVQMGMDEGFFKGQGAEEPKRYNVGGALVDADGNVIYEAPADQSDGGTANIQDYKFLDSLIAQYGENSPQVKRWWDNLRQNYSWQKFGDVPMPVSVSPQGSNIGGTQPTTAPISGEQQVQPTTQATMAGQSPADIAASNAAKVEEAKAGAKVTEERFAKIISDAPSTTRMAGFIGKISSNVIDAAEGIKEVVKKHPTASMGWASKIFVDNSGEKQVMRPMPGSLDDPAIQVATLANQMFGASAFTTLQEMRAASPTGGALGQVSNFEIDLLKNQFGAWSQESNAEFGNKQLDKIIAQAKLVNDLAMAEIATYQRIQGLGPNAPKEQIAELVNAGFKNMASIYKKHGRDSGTWDEETLTWSKSGDAAEPEEQQESIDDIFKRNTSG